jgi:hypothetical protein
MMFGIPLGRPDRSGALVASPTATPVVSSASTVAPSPSESPSSPARPAAGLTRAHLDPHHAQESPMAKHRVPPDSAPSATIKINPNPGLGPVNTAKLPLDPPVVPKHSGKKLTLVSGQNAREGTITAANVAISNISGKFTYRVIIRDENQRIQCNVVVADYHAARALQEHVLSPATASVRCTAPGGTVSDGSFTLVFSMAGTSPAKNSDLVISGR